MHDKELEKLKQEITNRKVLFILRLCDPWEHGSTHYWYRFVYEMLDHPRVHVMLNYQPAEITALFASRARRSQFVFAPYVYQAALELPIAHDQRKHRILFSGARDTRIYPLRNNMARTSTWWIPLRLMRETLDHPGYPDLKGTPVTHEIVGADYVDWLARFRFAAVCSSRCRLEFLKYREFAYAGVVPVGDMPATLLDCPGDAWVPWRRNFVALTRSLRAMADTGERAEKFRKFMREHRNAKAMRGMLTRQLERLA